METLVVVVAVLGFAGLGLLAGARRGWLAAAAVVVFVVTTVALTGNANVVSSVVFSVPPYLMGRLVRKRREAERHLQLRVRELEDERALFAELAVRRERSRIAGELHDLVGHALSVMVIQAAAGQRLAGSSPARADAALVAIAAAARQGEEDLVRLKDLLARGDAPDDALGLIDAMIERARAGGLAIRYSGADAQVPVPTAHLAYRIVQESLTNALRHAPGAAVDARVAVGDDALTVSVVNGPAADPGAELVPSGGSGLLGLGERVVAAGGALDAGPTPAAGWRVRASLPLR